MGAALDFVLRHRDQMIFLITPLVLLPLPLLVTDQKGTCGFLLLLMSVYWCTETLPLAVTGMLPVVFVPMFGILSTSDVCESYLKDTTMMFVGGLIVALAVENSMLHKRVAFRVLLFCGTKPRWLMLGFMLPTWFLSMWISNTATTAMMLPIMEAVLEQLRNKPNKLDPASSSDNCYENELVSGDLTDEKTQRNGHTAIVGSTEMMMTEMHGKSYDMTSSKQCDTEQPTPAQTHLQTQHQTHAQTHVQLDPQADDGAHVQLDPQADDGAHPQTDAEAEAEKEEADFMYFAKGMTLAVAYAANVGGIATLTGTGPNTIMKGHADDIWIARGYAESPVTYTSWMVIGMPVAAMCLVIVWLWLQLFYLGFRTTCGCCLPSSSKSSPTPKHTDEAGEKAAQQVLIDGYKNLGPLKFAEGVAGIMFITLVLLWFFRSPGFIDGWASFFPPGFIGDAVPAMMIASVLFIIPMELPTFSQNKGRAPVATLLTWKVVHEKYPWSIIFLMGGGFALADACVVSGLSQWIGDQLSVFGSLPGWFMLIIIGLLVAMLTEVTSNSATCTILMPIMSAMAEGLGFNPLYLMFPTCLCTSFAFMLPVATPPNAIAFSYGRLKVLDMVKAGAILNFLCVLVVTFATSTFGMAYFNLDELPWEAGPSNSTMTTMPPCVMP